MNDADLLTALDRLRSTMISVATGGPRIDSVNHEFQEEYRTVVDALAARGIENSLPYGDLWQWHGKWSADLVGYSISVQPGFVMQPFASRRPAPW